jgi:hypothetical protein
MQEITAILFLRFHMLGDALAAVATLKTQSAGKVKKGTERALKPHLFSFSNNFSRDFLKHLLLQRLLTVTRWQTLGKV